jgi:hypothetical protein
MDKEIELMKAIEKQIFQVHYKQVLDMLLLLPFDPNELKLSLNNLNHREFFFFSTKLQFFLNQLAGTKAHLSLPVKIATKTSNTIPAR